MPGERTVDAEPYPLSFELAGTALLVIDMQRDFLEPGGFGEMLGNDVSLLRKAIEPCRAVLAAARRAGLTVIHTREGHRPDLMDAPPSKLARGKLETGIGDIGPMGRILVRGEAGHGIIPELAPAGDEPVIDKPGKGAFYETDLDLIHYQLTHRPYPSVSQVVYIINNCQDISLYFIPVVISEFDLISVCLCNQV